MPSSKLIPLTPPTRKYLRYILSFVVTFGVGLVPLWGGRVIPGFHAILDVYSRELRDVIPFTSLIMSATAVGVQFFLGDSVPARRLNTFFISTFVIFIVLVLVTYIAYTAFVIQIQIPASKQMVAYLVGSEPLPTCECAKRGLEIRRCIGFEISVNPDEVAACFSREEISRRKYVLATLYMLVMLSISLMIGFLMMKEATKAQPAKVAGFRT